MTTPDASPPAAAPEPPIVPPEVIAPLIESGIVFEPPPPPKPAAPPAPEPAPAPEPRRRLRTWVGQHRLWAIASAFVAVLLVVLLGSYRVYGEWPWSAYPTRLHACGTGFDHHGHQTRAQITANGDTLVPMGKVPGWLNSGRLWTTSAGGALPGQKCHERMWVQTSGDSFELYTLPG